MKCNIVMDYLLSIELIDRSPSFFSSSREDLISSFSLSGLLAAHKAHSITLWYSET